MRVAALVCSDQFVSIACVLLDSVGKKTRYPQMWPEAVGKIVLVGGSKIGPKAISMTAYVAPEKMSSQQFICLK